MDLTTEQVATKLETSRWNLEMKDNSELSRTPIQAASSSDAECLARLVCFAMREREYNVRSCQIVRELILANWDAAIASGKIDIPQSTSLQTAEA